MQTRGGRQMTHTGREVGAYIHGMMDASERMNGFHSPRQGAVVSRTSSVTSATVAAGRGQEGLIKKPTPTLPPSVEESP